MKGKRCHEAGKEGSGARMGLGAGVVVWGGGGVGQCFELTFVGGSAEMICMEDGGVGFGRPP